MQGGSQAGRVTSVAHTVLPLYCLQPLSPLPPPASLMGNQEILYSWSFCGMQYLNGRSLKISFDASFSVCVCVCVCVCVYVCVYQKCTAVFL